MSGAKSTDIAGSPWTTGIGSPRSRFVGGDVVDEERSLRLEHLLGSTHDVSIGVRLVGEADAPLDRVRVAGQPGGEVEDADVDDLGVEDLLDLVADDVVDRLHLELTRERLLHAVDQRQLGVPLPRLVHQPRVLQRHAEAAGQRRPAAAVGVGERVSSGRRSAARSRRAASPPLDERHEEHRTSPARPETQAGLP